MKGSSTRIVARLVVIGLLGAFALPSTSLAQTASAAQYGGVAGQTIPPVIVTTPSSSPPAIVVAGEQIPPTVTRTVTKTETTPAAQVSPAVVTPARGTLPFTGFEVLLMLLAAAGLLAVGTALRRSTRAPSQA